MTRRILITGGAGFIGHHLVKYLLKTNNYSLRILDNLSHSNCAKQESLNNLNVEFIRGDVRDQPTVLQVAKDCEYIFHLAAQSNLSRADADPLYAYETNVDGTFNVLLSALKNRCKRVIFTSSREVYGNQNKLPVSESALLKPLNIYGNTKLIGEIFCQLFRIIYDLDVRILRLSNVFGPGDSDRVIPRFSYAVYHDRPLTIYGGDQILDFVWVDDVIHALWDVSQIYNCDTPLNCGSGHGITVRQLAERIGGISQKPFRVRVMPGRKMDVNSFIADTAQMYKVLGWVPDGDFLNHLPNVVHSYGGRVTDSKDV